MQFVYCPSQGRRALAKRSGDHKGVYLNPSLNQERGAHESFQAIRWAIEQGVDIISLSLALHRRPDTVTSDLQAAINDAEAKNIIVICSTMDDGRNVSIRDTLPAACTHTLSTVACDRYGGTLPYSDANSSDSKIYHVRGHGLPVGALEFVNGPPEPEGSSVSTAVAAGLASLILSCGRMANHLSVVNTPNGNSANSAMNGSAHPPSPTEHGWGKKLVMQKFDAMSDNGRKHVQTELLCGREGVNKRATADDVSALMRQYFIYSRN